MKSFTFRKVRGKRLILMECFLGCVGLGTGAVFINGVLGGAGGWANMSMLWWGGGQFLCIFL